MLLHSAGPAMSALTTPEACWPIYSTLYPPSYTTKILGQIFIN